MGICFCHGNDFIFVNVLNYGFDLSAVRDLAANKNDSLKMNQLLTSFSVKLFFTRYYLFHNFIVVLFVPRFIENRMIYLLASLLLIDLFSLRWFSWVWRK
jgi:hypothetical protein